MKIITRSEWGGRKPTGATPLASRDGFVIHWAGTHLGITSAAHAKAIWNRFQVDHMEGRNSDKTPWSDIAYNFGVDMFGNVYEGRGWSNRSAANGFGDANKRWLAICYIDGPRDSFTDDANTALRELIEEGHQHHGVGAGVEVHSHFFTTACPGDEIREWVAAGMPAPQPTPIVVLSEEELMTLVIDYAGVTQHPDKAGFWAWGRGGHVYAKGSARHHGGWDDKTRQDRKRHCVALVPTVSGPRC